MTKSLIATFVALGLTQAAHAQIQADTSSYPRPSAGSSMLDKIEKWQRIELQQQQIELQKLQLQRQRLRMHQAEMERQLEYERQQAEQFRRRHQR